MTTVASLLDDRDISEFVAALRDWPNSEFAYDQYSLAVSPFTTFYFSYDPQKYRDVSLALVAIHEEFEVLIGRPYRIATHPDSERPHPYGSKRLPDLRASAEKTQVNKQFVFSFTNETNHLSSPAKAAYFWRSSTWDKANNNGYSSIQLYYSWQWWMDQKKEWQRFVLDTIDRLQADQVYSGFAMANPLDLGARSEVTVWERALAPHFHGLDIDYPFGMSMELELGVRPPTWAFLLSDKWRAKLGLSRNQVRGALDDPRIRIADLDSGQWIELGDKPSLNPVDEGVPELQMRLNKLLKPIRASELGLIGFGQWDGDPNERFDRRDTQRWLARFDEDGDWPSTDARLRPIASPSMAVAQRPSSTPAGQPCTREGWWVTLAAATNNRRYFKAGELMPDLHNKDIATIWYWSEKQGQ